MRWAQIEQWSKFVTNFVWFVGCKVKFWAGCSAQTLHKVWCCLWRFVPVHEQIYSQTVSTQSKCLQKFKATGACRKVSGLLWLWCLQLAQDPFCALSNLGHFARCRFRRFRNVQNGVCANYTKLTEDLWTTLLYPSSKFDEDWIYWVQVISPQRRGPRKVLTGQIAGGHVATPKSCPPKMAFKSILPMNM